jgi:large subunit ribosomal protein L13
MKTFMAKKEDVERKWYVVDAADATLGRLATRIATYLTGKNKPQYTPHVDAGSFVIVVNAEKIRLTGRKAQQKTYYHYSGYQGGLKAITADKLLETHPDRLIRFAVRGMLPKNRLGRAMLKKLKVYAGPDHKHAAQKPEPMSATQ